MKELFLRSLKWIMLLLVALTTEKTLDSFCSWLSTTQHGLKIEIGAGKLEVWILKLPIQVSGWINFIITIFFTLCLILMILCLFLMIFRYFISAVFQIYDACAPHFKEVNPPEKFTRCEKHLIDIKPHHIWTLGIFLIPEFFCIYVVAVKLQETPTFFLGLLLLPFIDVLAFKLGPRLMKIQVNRARRDADRKIDHIARERKRRLKRRKLTSEEEAEYKCKQSELEEACRKAEHYYDELETEYNDSLEKAAETGPKFYYWDKRDFIAVLIFFVIYGANRLFTLFKWYENPSSVIDYIAVLIGVTLIFIVSYKNLKQNFPYYSRYLVFLMRA